MINPKLKYCKCGWTFTFGKWEYLQMLLFGDYTVSCPRCQNRMTFRLIYHTAKIETVEVKNKGELWRKG